ncbi:MAG: glycosyltransferase [Balneolaceae bacterium]|nr:glycosyltransferase [Balneolaceae bacterium]
MHRNLLTIAICTYNRADYLQDTLSDLGLQSCDFNKFEILVIDNNCTDHTEAIALEFAEGRPDISFRYILEENQGLSHARNRAVKEADSDAVLFIDDDVNLPARIVGVAIEKLSRQPEVLCAGGRIQVAFEDSDPDWIPAELMPMFGLHDLGDKDRRYPSGNFPRGGNMLIRKKVFDRAGLFRTDLGRVGSQLLGSEEKEFFDRARRKGIELHYWADLELWHRIGRVRLTKSYLRDQSVGIGASERLRVQGMPVRTALKFTSELVKFGGSLILAMRYRLEGRKMAAGFLLLFRRWVLRGFLNP